MVHLGKMTAAAGISVPGRPAAHGTACCTREVSRTSTETVMQTEWIHAFVLLKEKMNFTEAAEEMYVSASSFSKYIKALESALGVTLIDRSRHRFSLTPEGEAVYPYARKILEDCENMSGAARLLQSDNIRELHICVLAAANTSVYIRHILSFFEENPQLQLSLHEYDAREARKAFQNGSLDMMIGYTGSFEDLSTWEDPEEASVMILRREELFYAGITESGLDCIPLSEAVKDRLILHQNTFAEISGMLSLSGIDPASVRPIATTTSMDVLKAYLLSGTARSLLSLSSVQALSMKNRLVLTPIKENPTLSLGLIYRPKKLSAAGRQLLSYLQEMCSL